MDYLQFILLFIAFGGLLTYLLIDVTVYLESLGFVSVFTEAMLGAPQFYRNFRNKSTDGMRYDRYVLFASSFFLSLSFFI